MMGQRSKAGNRNPGPWLPHGMPGFDNAIDGAAQSGERAATEVVQAGL
jgi:hypothetical protein